jgi:enediyne core biosynthesis thioesterase
MLTISRGGRAAAKCSCATRPPPLNDLANGLALVTTLFSCEYLAELMAFDEVRLDMRLKAMSGNRAAFTFQYWRCNRSPEDLVATGEQEIACLRSVAGQMGSCDVPLPLRAALRPYERRAPLP